MNKNGLYIILYVQNTFSKFIQNNEKNYSQLRT